MNSHLIIQANDHGTMDVLLNRPDRKRVGEIKPHYSYPDELNYKSLVTDTLLCQHCLQYILDYIKAHQV